MSGAVSFEIQRAFRGVDRQDRSGGDELPGGVLSRDDGPGMEGAGPGFLLHEPAAGLRGDLSEPAAGRGHVFGGEEPA